MSRPDPRPGRRRALSPFRCLPALALLLGALSPFAAAPAAADVLVSNTGQTLSNLVSHVYDPTDGVTPRAQAFTTGSYAAGYILSGIDIRGNFEGTVAARNLGNFRAELWSSGGAGAPDSKIIGLTPLLGRAPHNDNVVVSFSAPADTRLAANTAYHIVLYRTDSLRNGIRTTSSDGEDSGGETGWSIADHAYIGSARPPSATWTADTDSVSLMIRVNGSRVGALTAPAAPRRLSSVAPLYAYGELALTWTAPVGTVTGYEVDYTSSGTVAADAAASGTDAAAGWVAASRTRTDTTASQTISGLTGGTAYRVRVRAVNAGVAGAWAFGTGVPRTAPATAAWAATLTVRDLTNSTDNGCDTTQGATAEKCSTVATLTEDEFAVGGRSYSIRSVVVSPTGYFQAQIGGTPNASLRALKFCVGTTAFSLSSLARIQASNNYDLQQSGTSLRWSPGDRVSLSIEASCTPTTTTAPPLVSPGNGSLSLALTAGGSPVTVKKRSDSEVHWHATVPYGTSQVTVTPTWTNPAHVTGTVQSRDYPSNANGHTWPVLTAETAVTSGGSVTVDLASGNPDVHSPTSVTIVLTRADRYSKAYHLEVTQGGEIEANLSIAPATVMEGGKATVTVTLSQPVPKMRDMRIPVTFSGAARGEDWRIEVGENAFWGAQDPYILVRMGQRSGTMDLRTRAGSAGKTLTVALDTANLPSGTSFGVGANGLQGATPWSVVAGTTASVARTITEDTRQNSPQTSAIDVRWAALIEKIREWRNDPRYSSNKAHTDRWDRVLLAFGLPVPDRSLRAMSAAEAQTYADRGWTRWVAVAEALRAVEGPPPPLPDPVVTIAGDGPVTEGAAAGFTLTASRAPSADLAVAVSLSQYGAFAQPSALGARTVTIPAGATSAAFTVATVDDNTDEADGAIAATLAGGAGYTLGDAARATVKVADNDEDNPGLVTKRAIAREGTDDAAVFTVRLERPASHAVTVDYATADGAGAWAGTAPARAGADYTATSGTLTFAAGETSKTVRVPILDDAIDEGMEYFLLRFSNPQGARLEAGYRETQGLIRNSDPLPQAWLGRFGRTVAADAVAAVTARLETPRAAGSHLTVAGQRLDLARAGDGRALTDALTGLARTFGAPDAPTADDDPFGRHGPGVAWDDPAATAAARRVTARELLTGTAFRAVLGGGAGAQFTTWGQGLSVSAFSSAVPGLSLSGEAATGSLGMDYERGRVLAGFAMLHSLGDGTARGANRSYALGSTVTTVLPFAQFALSERISAWGLAGTGSGRLTLDVADDAAQRYRTDLAMTLAAVGVRGDLVTPAAVGGFALALKADAFWVRTESDSVLAPGVGNLAASQAEASRLRAVLDGSRTFTLAGGRALTPSLTLGVRHDGGDEGIGTGMEVGAALGYADPSRGLDATLRLHGLAAHAGDDRSEWGVSGSLRLVPGDAGRRAVCVAHAVVGRGPAGCGAAVGDAGCGGADRGRRGAGVEPAGHGAGLRPGRPRRLHRHAERRHRALRCGADLARRLAADAAAGRRVRTEPRRDPRGARGRRGAGPRRDAQERGTLVRANACRLSPRTGARLPHGAVLGTGANPRPETCARSAGRRCPGGRLAGP